MVEWFGAIYAVLVATGGTIGYFKAGSVPSLSAGLAGGAVAALGAYLENYWILIAVSGLLGGVMTFRAVNSGKFMPAGVVAVLSGLLFIRCVVYFIGAASKARIH